MTTTIEDYELVDMFLRGQEEVHIKRSAYDRELAGATTPAERRARRRQIIREARQLRRQMRRRALRRGAQ